MTTPHDDYKRLDIPPGVTMLPCPVCAADAELWQFSKSDTSPTSKAGMCQNGDKIGPQDGIAGAGCLLFMPPDEFYKATIREAVKYWNDYAQALGQLRRARQWKRYSALRDANVGPREQANADEAG